jgi:threonine/homoserine/homoserine lactone efflux protein
MFDASTFALFVAAALALLLVPGPAVLYVVTRSVDPGRPAGLASVLGVGIGSLVHITFAAIGLSALLVSSAAAFSAVKWLGAAYLIWLGLQRLLTLGEEDAPAAVEPQRLSRVFLHGVVVNVLNPKTALFFLAFLPQFVDPARGAAWMQIIVLGATFVAVGLCTDSLYALLGGTAGDWLRRKSQGESFRWMRRYVPGGVYIALGAATAVSGSGKD